MCKNLLPGLCVVMISLFSINQIRAQEGAVQYQYKDFRFPDIDRPALEGSLSLLNSGNLNVNHGPGPVSASSRSAFSNIILLDYSRFRNLEKIQATENLKLNQSYMTQSVTTSGTSGTTSTGSLQLFPQYESEYRYYYVPNKFWGYAMDIESDYAYNFSRTPTNRQTLHELEIDVTPTLLFGWGRLEPIDDVFLAKFMVDDMKEAGMLTQDLTQEELFSLGSMMAFVRNQRIFDFRRLRMFELSEIDRWFTDSGLIENQDFRYFTVLNDNWLYAYRNTRFSGKRTSFGISPSVQWRDGNLGDGNHQRARLGINIGANYQVHTPINQYWQSILEISGGMSFYCHNCGDVIDNTFFPFVRAAQTYSWYPNSRTRVHLNGSLSYTPFYEIDDTVVSTVHNFMSGINLSADYFLNFQLRVRAEIAYVYRFNDYSSEDITRLDLTQSTLGFHSNITFLYTFF